MARTATDDLDLLATRLRLGIPLNGFDGEPIPLRHTDGREIDPEEAAERLLESGASLLKADEIDDYVERALWRARAVEGNSIAAGDPPAITAAKVTGALVSAAIRAAILAQAAHASPSDLNRATLAWYEVHDLRSRQLIDATASLESVRLTA